MTGTIAILDPFSGIAGDMTLGALVAVGLDPDWLRALPAALGLDGVTVQIRDVQRAGIACTKVDFEIPPQPHGRHLRHIRALVEQAGVVPDDVRALADRAFVAIAEQEAAIHGVSIEKVHLHEVGAVDAILDVVGSIWGLSLLGVERVFCGPIQAGDGFVRAAHGVLPVPAPATLRLLEGMLIHTGPDGAGELVTPTGAALAKVLSAGPIPAAYVPERSGFGAGTKEFSDRANALRIILGRLGERDEDARVESLIQLVADVDDATPEQIADAADRIRASDALDVVVIPTVMKKGRPGMRLEVLARPADASTLEALLFAHTPTIGVRRWTTERRALARETVTVDVDGHSVRLKVVRTPTGERRAKPEFDDVAVAARALGRSTESIARAACAAFDL